MTQKTYFVETVKFAMSFSIGIFGVSVYKC